MCDHPSLHIDKMLFAHYKYCKLNLRGCDGDLIRKREQTYVCRPICFPNEISVGAHEKIWDFENFKILYKLNYIPLMTKIWQY